MAISQRGNLIRLSVFDVDRQGAYSPEHKDSCVENCYGCILLKLFCSFCRSGQAFWRNKPHQNKPALKQACCRLAKHNIPRLGSHYESCASDLPRV